MTGTGRDWVSAKVIRLPSFSAARSANGRPVRRSSVLKPSVARRPLVVPGQRQDRLGGVGVLAQRRAPGRAAGDDAPVLRGQVLDLGVRVGGDALGGQPDGLDHGAERGHLLRDRGVVALDHAPAAASSCPGSARTHPCASPAPRRRAGRWRRWCRAAAARRPGPGACPRCFSANQVNPRAMRWNASKSVLVSQGGEIAGENACTKGCMSVLDRSCFSYQVAAGSTTSENSVVLVIRKSSESSRSSLPAGASSRHRTSTGRRPPASSGAQVGVRAEQVLEEVLVALGGGAEQVRPPHRQAAREVLRGVGVLAGEASAAPDLSWSTTCVAGSSPRRVRLVDQVEGIAVEGRVARHPTQPGGRARCCPRSCAPRTCPFASGEAITSAVNGS